MQDKGQMQILFLKKVTLFYILESCIMEDMKWEVSAMVKDVYLVHVYKNN